jgi:diguanylate cyclase (GGDEF)-like protein/PAS domain S-box-containing protein
MATRWPLNTLHAADLERYAKAEDAVWVQDTHRHRVIWANAVAKVVLDAQSDEELYTRDVSPLLPATKLRIAQYQERLQRGEIVTTQWTTFLRGMKPLAFLSQVHPYALADGLLGFLFIARNIGDSTCSEALRLIEASRHSVALFSLYSMAGELLECNPSMYAAFGESLRGFRDSFRAYFQDSSVADSIRAAVRDRGSYSGRHLVATQFGNRWHQVQVATLLDPRDAAPTLHVQSMDVSREVEAETKAREFEQLLSSMADANGQPVGYIGNDRRYRFVNRAYTEWTGRPAADLIGAGVADVIGPGPDASLVAAWPRLAAGERVTFERRMDVPGRGHRHIAAEVVPHRVDHEIQGAFIYTHDIHAQRMAEAEARTTEQKLRLVSDNLPVIVVQVDAECRIAFANQAFCDWIQRHVNVLIGLHIADAAGGPRYAVFADALARAFGGERSNFRGESPEGETLRHFDYTIAPFREVLANEEAAITGAVVVINDVDERVRAASTLRRTQEELTSHLNATPLAVIQIDAFRRVTHWSGRAEPVFGWASRDVFGRSLDEMGLFESEQAARFDYELRFLDAGDGERFTLAARNLRRDGQAVFCEWYCSVVRDEAGHARSYLALVQDVSERVNAERHLNYLASHDVLTGLANRNRFNEQLRHALERKEPGLYLLFLDLDRFKFVNDSLGQHEGDNLLRQVADRLRRLAPHAFAAARLGADEFALLLPRNPGESALPPALTALHRELNQPFRVGSDDMPLAISAGVSAFPEDGPTEGDLVRRADWALYRAKDGGRGTIQTYAAVADPVGINRLSLESELRRALDRGQLELHYQPKQQLGTSRIGSAEALIRWRHPNRGLVPPDLFIPLAEENGLIDEIGRWVMHEACRQAAQWRLEHGDSPQIAINLSGVQLKRTELGMEILTALRDHQLAGAALMVEVTETAMITDAHQAGATLELLRQHGVQAAIDDFGKGFSSLTQLKRLPIDALKIESSFVRDVVSDRDDATIVLAIIGLARNLGLKTIAEGVETAEQMHFLKQNNCDEMQGYLLSRPLSALDYARVFLPKRRGGASSPKDVQ